LTNDGDGGVGGGGDDIDVKQRKKRDPEKNFFFASFFGCGNDNEKRICGTYRNGGSGSLDGDRR